ncbi:MAG: glycosyltransferase [Nitrososphaerales archaeon]
MKNDLLFFTSPIDLGHASRDVAIASRLDSNVSFVSGEHAVKMISGHGFIVKDLYRHNGFEVSSSGELIHPLRWIMNYYSFYKKCKDIARGLIDNHTLVVAGEDFAAISVAEESKIPNIVITDILQINFTKGIAAVIEKKMNRAMAKMINKSTLVIIPDHGDDVDNLAYVGPIVREVRRDRERLREEFGFSNRTILVSRGTSAGSFLVNKAVDTYKKMKGKLDAEMIVVSGLALHIELQGVKCVGYVNNLHEMIYASDLLISLAGRSTIDEANTYGTPGIFIPIRNHFEQVENAEARIYVQ